MILNLEHEVVLSTIDNINAGFKNYCVISMFIRRFRSKDVFFSVRQMWLKILSCWIPLLDIELYDDVTILTEQYPIDVEVQFNYIYSSESLF